MQFRVYFFRAEGMKSSWLYRNRLWLCNSKYLFRSMIFCVIVLTLPSIVMLFLPGVSYLLLFLVELDLVNFLWYFQIFHYDPVSLVCNFGNMILWQSVAIGVVFLPALVSFCVCTSLPCFCDSCRFSSVFSFENPAMPITSNSKW